MHKAIRGPKVRLKTTMSERVNDFLRSPQKPENQEIARLLKQRLQDKENDEAITERNISPINRPKQAASRFDLKCPK